MGMVAKTNEEEEEKERYRCDRCGATFGDEESLEKHMKTHQDEDKKAKEPLEQGTTPPATGPQIPPPMGPPVR